MFASQATLWPVAVVVGGTLVVSGFRYLALFVGFRLTLKGAPKPDRLAIYREFARALSHRAQTEDDRRPLRRTQHLHVTPGRTKTKPGSALQRTP